MMTDFGVYGQENNTRRGDSRLTPTQKKTNDFMPDETMSMHREVSNESLSLSAIDLLPV